MVVGSDSFADRRVFVTGATGLLGSWLVKELLARKAFVAILVRDADPQSELIRSGAINRTHVVHGALEDFSSLERALSEYEIDAVFHLAAQPIVGVAHKSPMQTFETNVRGTYNLLEACRIHRDTVRSIVVASSDKAYGEHTSLPYTEDMPLEGRHPYEVSKSCADLIAQSYFHTYGLPLTIARCGNIYGGGDLNWSRIVPGAIRSLIRGERPVIRSDGQYIRDYIYVKDAVCAYLCSAHAALDSRFHGHAFNFSPDSRVTVLELVNLIRGLMGATTIEAEIRNTARGEIRSQYLSAAKARQELSWAPNYTIERGLSETIAWYGEFLA